MEVDLLMKEVSGRGEGLRYVGKQVGHGLVNASPVHAAVDPLTVLGEGGVVECFGSAVPAKVGELHTVAEAFVEGGVLGGMVNS